MLRNLWSLVKLLLETKVIEKLLIRFFPAKGLYEVLSYHCNLEIHDKSGDQATYSKKQKVRFLQNNILAYQDQAWGDGESFADYQCSPGIPVDRYQDGNIWRILISLREVKSRGDVSTFHIERKIKDGFPGSTEYLQTKIDHATRYLEMSVVFPKQRPPRRFLLQQTNANRTKPLSNNHIHQLPDKRIKVTWSTKKPQLFEMYTLRWEW